MRFGHFPLILLVVSACSGSEKLAGPILPPSFDQNCPPNTPPSQGCTGIAGVTIVGYTPSDAPNGFINFGSGNPASWELETIHLHDEEILLMDSDMQEELACGVDCRVNSSCDPAIHPNCLKKLTNEERAVVDSALSRFNESSDSLCHAARQAVTDALSSGWVTKGSNADGTDHDAMTYGKNGVISVHFDDDVFTRLDSAQMTLEEFAGLVIHEGFHLLRNASGQHYSHPAAEQYPYTTYPFNKVESGSQPCVQ